MVRIHRKSIKPHAYPPSLIMRRRARSLQVIIAYVCMGSIGARYTRTTFVISGVQPVLGDFTTVFYVSSILSRDRRRNVRCVNMACPGRDNTICMKVHPKVEYYTWNAYTFCHIIHDDDHYFAWITPKTHHSIRITCVRHVERHGLWLRSLLVWTYLWQRDNGNNRNTLHFTTIHLRFYDSKLFFERKKLFL